MTERDEHFEHLLSELTDGTLAADEQAQARDAIDRDAAAARTAEDYQRLDRLLGGWRCLPDDADLAGFGRRVAERVAQDQENRAVQEPGGATDDPATAGIRSEYAEADRLVEQWAGPMPEVDWAALSSRISSAVRNEAGLSTVGRKRRPLAKWFGVVGTPLATAAALGLAAIWWIGDGIGGRTAPTPVALSFVSVELDRPASAGIVLISFEELPVDEEPARFRRQSAGQAVAFGPRADEYGESAVDDGFFW